MFYVPIYIEALRSRPHLLFWLATLAQALLWLLVPVLFYAAPPGGLAQLLAVARDLPLASDFGPPLAYWLADIAFRTAGLFGVYLLSQICVIATYWCVYALGRATVGPTHATIAVLLMIGIFAFAAPTPDFGPPILAMALWAAALLFYWRAVGEGRRRYWYAFAAAMGCLLLTSEFALVFLAVVIAFTAATDRGFAALDTLDAVIATVVVVAMVFLHFVLLERAGFAIAPALERLRLASAAGANTAAWLQLLALLVFAHAGLILLAVVGLGGPRSGTAPAPVIARPAAAPFAATFIKAFAFAPVLLATIACVIGGVALPLGAAAPLLVLSALALVMLAGDAIVIYHQRVVGFAWSGLLLVPAIFVPLLIAVLPWASGTELSVAQPANAMGRFFADSFSRRTGRPLAFVGGDPRMAELVALGAPSNPRVYFAAGPARSPSITADTLREQGAVIVWPAPSANPEPPAEIKARFPDLAPEVPHTFARPVRGRLPPLFVGWGVIRPAR